MNNPHIDALNEIIARELGKTPYGDEGIYRWSWSNDLKWPAFATGRKVETLSEGGLVVMRNEYAHVMQTNMSRCWVMTKWFSPEHLQTWGWESLFPGAPIPSRGYRVPTNCYVPQGRVPTEMETITAIYGFKQILEQDARQITQEFEDKLAASDKAKKDAVDDQVEDLIPAALNPAPGKRGGHVSFPAVTQVNGKSTNLIIH